MKTIYGTIHVKLVLALIHAWSLKKLMHSKTCFLTIILMNMIEANWEMGYVKVRITLINVNMIKQTAVHMILMINVMGCQLKLIVKVNVTVNQVSLP